MNTKTNCQAEQLLRQPWTSARIVLGAKVDSAVVNNSFSGGSD